MGISDEVCDEDPRGIFKIFSSFYFIKKIPQQIKIPYCLIKKNHIFNPSSFKLQN